MKRRGKKRGPKGSLTPALQRHITESLQKCNTIKTSMQNAGLSERVFYDWMKKPSFAAAVYRARAKAKAKLVRVIINQAPRDWRAAAFLLERSYADEYSRVSVERVEQIGEPPDDKKLNLSIYYDTGGVGIEKLTAFPIHSSMAQGHDFSLEVEAEKQRRLTASAPASEEISDESEETESPSKVVNPALTGRIRPEWKGNGK